MTKVYTRKMLLKRISGAVKPNRLITASEQETIILFKESSTGKARLTKADGNHRNAHELFNQFTAGVIKSKVTFTR